jgi:DNA mismatch endonuclease, patch repair protein
VADVLTPEQRRRNMRRIRSRDTKPELIIRRGLHALGLRFRLHRKDLPGTPDIVFPKYKAVIQVHGCFWHGHDCPMFKWPSTRPEFWKKKIVGNRQRDQAAFLALRKSGWRVLVVWECALFGPGRESKQDILVRCIEFLEESNKGFFEIRAEFFNQEKMGVN